MISSSNTGVLDKWSDDVTKGSIIDSMKGKERLEENKKVLDTTRFEAGDILRRFNKLSDDDTEECYYLIDIEENTAHKEKTNSELFVHYQELWGEFNIITSTIEGIFDEIDFKKYPEYKDSGLQYYFTKVDPESDLFALCRSNIRTNEYKLTGRHYGLGSKNWQSKVDSKTGGAKVTVSGAKKNRSRALNDAYVNGGDDGNWINIYNKEEIVIKPYKMNTINFGYDINIAEGYEAIVFLSDTMISNYDCLLASPICIKGSKDSNIRLKLDVFSTREPNYTVNLNKIYTTVSDTSVLKDVTGSIDIDTIEYIIPVNTLIAKMRIFTVQDNIDLRT